MTLILIFPPPKKKMKKMKLFYCFEFKMRIFCIYTPLLFIVLQIHKSVLFQIYCKILKVWCIYAPEICTGGNQNSAFYKNSEQSKIETVFFKKKKKSICGLTQERLNAILLYMYIPEERGGLARCLIVWSIPRCKLDSDNFLNTLLSKIFKTGRVFW